MNAWQFSQTVWTWRTRGAVFYTLCTSANALLFWDLLCSFFLPSRAGRASFAGWLASSVIFCALQPLLVAAHAQSLQANDGFALPSLLLLGPKAAASPLMLLARLIHRFSTLARAKSSALLMLGNVVGGGGLTTIYLVRRLGRGADLLGEVRSVLS